MNVIEGVILFVYLISLDSRLQHVSERLETFTSYLQLGIGIFHDDIDAVDKRLGNGIRDLQNEIIFTKNMLLRTQDQLETVSVLQDNTTAELKQELKNQRTKFQELNERNVVMNKTVTNWTQNQLKSITDVFDKKIILLPEGLEKEHATAVNLKNEIVEVTNTVMQETKSSVIDLDKKIASLQEGLEKDQTTAVHLKKEIVKTTNNIMQEIKSIATEFDKKIVLLQEGFEKNHATVVNLKNEIFETTKNIMEETKSIAFDLDKKVILLQEELEKEHATVVNLKNKIN